MFVSVGDEGIVSESPEFVMICAAVPWRWSGFVGTMMTLGDFDVRVVGVEEKLGTLFIIQNLVLVEAIAVFCVQSLPRVNHQTERCNFYLE